MDIEIIDIHQHVGSNHGWVEQVGKKWVRGASFEDSSSGFETEEQLNARWAIMRKAGVSRSVLIAGHGYPRDRGLADTRAVNDRVASLVASQPDMHPCGIGLAEPSFGRAGLSEIARVKELGLRGVSFHCRFQGVSLSSGLMIEYVGAVCDNGLVPFLHCIGDLPDEALWRLEALAHEFPEHTLVALDAFCGAETIRQLFAVAERMPNVVFDTSLAAKGSAVVEFARRFGSARVAFGTDQYTTSSAENAREDRALSQVLGSNLPADDKASILGGNARRILGF